MSALRYECSITYHSMALIQQTPLLYICPVYISPDIISIYALCGLSLYGFLNTRVTLHNSYFLVIPYFSRCIWRRANWLLVWLLRLRRTCLESISRLLFSSMRLLSIFREFHYVRILYKYDSHQQYLRCMLKDLMIDEQAQSSNCQIIYRVIPRSAHLEDYLAI